MQLLNNQNRLKVKKCWHHLLYADIISFISLKRENVKKYEKSVEVVNIEERNLHIFKTIWGISVKL